MLAIPEHDNLTLLRRGPAVELSSVKVYGKTSGHYGRQFRLEAKMALTEVYLEQNAGLFQGLYQRSQLLIYDRDCDYVGDTDGSGSFQLAGSSYDLVGFLAKYFSKDLAGEKRIVRESQHRRNRQTIETHSASEVSAFLAQKTRSLNAGWWTREDLVPSQNDILTALDDLFTSLRNGVTA